jgi:tetratricopeptide (TPR) repeat protein
MLNAATIGSRFACWAATHALLSVAADGFSPHSDTAEEALVGMASVNPRSAWPSLALALLDWEHDDLDDAGELLETAVEADPRVVPAWALLSLRYADSGDITHAESVCREAIAGNVADPSIQFLLAGLLLDHGGQTEAEDESRVREALTLLEQAEVDGLADPAVALRAMDAAEALNQDEAVWTAFERILDYDKEGSTIWEIVEYANTYTDFTKGFALLRKFAEEKQSYMHYAALAMALIRCERLDEAQAIVQTMRALASDDYARAETAQLALESADPAFEERFNELMADLDEGIIPDSAAIEFLVAALAAEPQFADGAVALAESYEARDEVDLAADVLAKARKELPNHLELVLATADLLWLLDEDEEALALLLQANASHPEDVAILARLAEYYFEIGDDEQSRLYIERAEALDPTHPEFLRVEEQIADALVDEDEFSDQDNAVDE